MPRPIVIGIDPATTCGYAVGRVGSVPTLSSAKLGGSKASLVEIFGSAASLINRLIDDFEPVLLAVEKPFFIAGESNYGATETLHGIYGAIIGLAASRGIEVWPVAVATWRSVTLGSAKLGGRSQAKRAMMDYCKALRWHAVDDNAADAGGIWNWAATTFAPYGVITR